MLHLCLLDEEKTAFNKPRKITCLAYSTWDFKEFVEYEIKIYVHFPMPCYTFNLVYVFVLSACEICPHHIIMCVY